MTQFGSPREALGYLYRCQDGPGMARPRWSDAPRRTDRVCWDHVQVGALLYGPRAKGMCGVVRGGLVDRELRLWALTPGAPRSPRVRNVVIRLRKLMREHGLKRPHPKRPECDVVEFTDAEGVERRHQGLTADARHGQNPRSLGDERREDEGDPL